MFAVIDDIDDSNSSWRMSDRVRSPVRQTRSLVARNIDLLLAAVTMRGRAFARLFVERMQ